MNIVEGLFAKGFGDAVALISGDETVTFRELAARVEAGVGHVMAAGFPERRAGVVPRVGLACPNSIQHVVLALVILRAGGCLVPIASELTAAEREGLVQTVGLDAILLADSMPWPQRFEGPGEQAHLPELGATLFTRLGATVPDLDEAAFAALNPAFIRFSSGTTGRAKGVVVSHESLLQRIETANGRLQITPQDRVVWILPMAHHFAVSIMLYLLKGAATIIVSSHLAEDVLEAGRTHGGTVLYGALVSPRAFGNGAIGHALAYPALGGVNSGGSTVPHCNGF